MKLIVPVEIEVEGNNCTAEELMAMVEYCLDAEGYEDVWEHGDERLNAADIQEIWPTKRVINSLRVVFPEHTKD